MAAPVLTSISPDIVPGNGGYSFVITGTFELDMPYRIHVGPSGDSTDPGCYSGSGLGNDVVSTDGTTLSAWFPEMTPGEAYNVYVQERDTPGNNDLLTDVVRAIDRDYSTSLWSMKSLFPPNRKMGVRNFAALASPEYPKNLFTWTEDLSDTDWVKSLSSVVISEADPLGTTRGSILHEDATPATPHAVGQVISFVVGNLYVMSVYAKAINRDHLFLGDTADAVAFDLVNGVVTDTDGSPVASSITSVDHLGETGWWRCEIVWRATLGSPSTGMGAMSTGLFSTGLVFNGLDQDSVRLSFPALDLWSVARMYRMTEGAAAT